MAPPSRLQLRKVQRAINALTVPEDVSIVVHKRSFPFEDAGFHPRLSDVLRLGARSKIVVLARDPRQCATSVLRRGFVATIEDAADRVEAAGATLRAELETLPPASYLVLSYQDMLREPSQAMGMLERFLDYVPGALQPHTEMIGRPNDQSSKLAESHRKFLEDRFAEKARFFS
jgi:hypothetical protein